MLLKINWESIFVQRIPEGGPEFWLKAGSAKNAGGDLVLKDLGPFTTTKVESTHNVLSTFAGFKA